MLGCSPRAATASGCCTNRFGSPRLPAPRDPPRVDVLPRSVSARRGGPSPDGGPSRGWRARRAGVVAGRASRCCPRWCPPGWPRRIRAGRHARGGGCSTGRVTHVVLDRAGRTLLRTWGDDRRGPVVARPRSPPFTLRVARARCAVRAPTPTRAAGLPPAPRRPRPRPGPRRSRALDDGHLPPPARGPARGVAQLLADREAVFGPATTPRSPGLDALQALLTGATPVPSTSWAPRAPPSARPTRPSPPATSTGRPSRRPSRSTCSSPDGCTPRRPVAPRQRARRVPRSLARERDRPPARSLDAATAVAEHGCHRTVAGRRRPR